VSREAAAVVAGSPALIASLAISIGVVIVFVANLFIALGAPSGTSGKLKLLQFLSPSDVAVAAAMILAVALVALHQQRPTGRDEPAHRAAAHAIALVAGTVGALVALAAIVRAIVSLTVSEKGFLKAGGFVDGLGSALVAAAAALWGLHRIHAAQHHRH
jgi:type IV secretory pathway VirB2 component (pilin)